jgi:hypothetical protein
VRRTLAAVLPPIVSGIALVPVIVEMSGLGKTAIGAGLVAFSLAVTRILAVPGVNDWLRRHVPWLAAAGTNGR